MPEPEDARQGAAAGGTGRLEAQEEARSAAVPAPRAYRRDTVAQNSAPTAPAAPASDQAAPQPAPPPAAAGARARDEMRRELSASAVDVQTRSEADAAKLAAPAQESLAEEKPVEQALAKRKAAAQPPHPQDPKVWLQQIEALRSQGKTAQADAEMQRFRAAFPNYPLTPRPPDTP